MPEESTLREPGTGHGVPRYPFSFRGDRLAPELARLVREQPVCEVRTHTGDRAWLVTGHAQVRQVFRDRRFSLGRTSDPAAPRQDPLLPPPTVTHTRAYFERVGLLEEVFRGLGPRQPFLPPARVRETAREVLAAFLTRRQPADLVEGFVLPLSRSLTLELLGLPPGGSPDSTTLLGLLSAGPEAGQSPEGWTECTRWMAAELPRLRTGRTGLLGRLLPLAEASGELTEEEIVELFLFLVASTFGNPATFLATAVVALSGAPDEARRLRAEPELLPRAVEELLRWSMFLGDALPRIAREDAEVGGVLIREGELVLLSTDAANHDPLVFPEPGRLDLGRRPGTAHQRFGDGRHRCPGAPVSRMLAAESLRALLEGTSGLRLAVPADDLAWHTRYAVVLPVALPVCWTAPGANGPAATVPRARDGGGPGPGEGK